MVRASGRLALILAALVSAYVPLAAHAQGVLARGADGEIVCVPGGAETHEEVSCDEISCAPPRVCLDLPGLGARCLDRATEIVCVPGEAGCDACPLISTGADPESCRVVDLAAGPHALCFYGTQPACIGESALDVAACLPETGDAPSIAAGDCDGDGVANDVDRCLCESAPRSPDGCPFDGGVAPDASVARDAGAPARDAAALPFDAATSDAAQDDVRPSFRGGGGCACRAAGRRPGGGAWLVLGLALALLSRRAPGSLVRACL